MILLFVKGTADNYTLSQLVNYGKTSSTLNSSLVPLTRLPAGLVSLDAIYYITLGLWVLIMTPVTVVFVAFLAYVKEENFVYAILSAIVLVNIFVAMLFIPGLIGN